MTTEDNVGIDLEKVMGRVRKMMALANDAGASEGERDNALRMAHTTLAKYNLTLSQAQDAGATKAEKRTRDGTMRTSDMPWVIRSCHAVGALFFCEYYFQKERGTGKAYSYFIGREANVMTAKEMAAYVVKSIQREANLQQKANYEDGKWNRDFCKGAAAQVWDRCRAIRAEAESAKPTPGTSLVLASVYASERDANKQYLVTLGVKLGKAKGGERPAGSEAHAAGSAFGSKLNLSRQLGTSGSDNKRLK